MSITTLAYFYAVILALMGIFVSRRYRHTRNDYDGGTTGTLASFLLVALGGITAFAWIIYLRATSLPFIDLVPSVSQSMEMMRSGFYAGEVALASSLTHTLPYSPWFFLTQAVLLTAAGGPAVNSVFLLIIPVNGIICAGLYSLFRRFLPEEEPRRSAIAWTAALIFAFFSGFGWLLLPVKSVDNVASLTALDTRYPYFFEIVDGFRTSSLGLIVAIGCVLVTTGKPTITQSKRIVLISFLSFAGLLVHPLVTFLVVSLILSYLAFAGKIQSLTIVRDSLSVAAGGFLYLIMSWWTAWNGIPLLIVVLYIGVSATAMPIFGGLRHLFGTLMQRKPVHFRLRSTLILLITALCISLYLYSVVIWGQVSFRSLSYAIVPWYVYPIRLGIVGVLCILAFTTAVASHRRDRTVIGLSLFSLISFVLFKAIGETYGILFSEARLIEFLNIFLAPLSAYYLFSLIGNHLTKLKISLLVLIVVLGTGSMVTSLGYWTSGPHLGSVQDLSSEYPALMYIYDHRPLGSYIAAFDWRSRNYVDLSGSIQNQLWVQRPFLEETDAQSLAQYLSVWNISYVYLSPRDTPYLTSQALFNATVQKTITFPSTNVKLANLAHFDPMSRASSTVLVVPATNNIELAIAKAGIDYTSRLPFDIPYGSTLVLDDSALKSIGVNLALPSHESGILISNTTSRTVMTFKQGSNNEEWMWSRYDVGNISTDELSHLHFSGSGSELPLGARYYYLEAWNESSAIFSHPLQINGSDQSFDFTLPPHQKLRSIFIALDAGSAKNVTVNLQIDEVRLNPDSGQFWKESSSLSIEAFKHLMQGGRVIVLGKQNPSPWISSLLQLRVSNESESIDGTSFAKSYVPLKQAEHHMIQTLSDAVHVQGQYKFGNTTSGPVLLTGKVGPGNLSYAWLEPLISSASSPGLPELSTVLSSVLVSFGAEAHKPTKQFLGYTEGLEATGIITASSRFGWTTSNETQLMDNAYLRFSNITIEGGSGGYVHIKGKGADNQSSYDLFLWQPTISIEGTAKARWSHFEAPLPLTNWDAPLEARGSLQLTVVSAGKLLYVAGISFSGQSIRPSLSIFVGPPMHSAFYEELGGGLVINDAPYLALIFGACFGFLTLRNYACRTRRLGGCE
ncbi:MAG TPA: hypothetical protein VFE98_02595 [Candidatus Bathyarchaeia archaeon]|nr:hypothetical protein [Candidatus Bathyarchaeia archaeon]